MTASQANSHDPVHYVFRAKDTTAKLTASDWSGDKKANTDFGQEQTFNFREIQPYHE